MIGESLHFVKGGISSQDMKVTRVSSSGGLFEETFLATKTIIEEQIRGNDTPYHYGVRRDPLTIPLSLWFDEDMTDDEVRAVTRWIDTDYFEEFYFTTRPDRRFYVMYEGDSTRLHNGIEKGKVTLQLRTTSPYSFSPVYSSEIYDLSNNTFEGKEIIYENKGDTDTKPILKFEMVGDGDITIINKSDGGREFKMFDLLNGERITVDNHYEDIETDIPGNVFRYDNHNRVYLNFKRGFNYLQVYGNVKDLQFISQFNTKF